MNDGLIVRNEEQNDIFIFDGEKILLLDSAAIKHELNKPDINSETKLWLSVIIAIHEQNPLYNLCKGFINKHTISCPECISQSDNVITDAYDFIEEICNQVGYYDNPNSN